jgi:urease accessory protein
MNPALTRLLQLASPTLPVGAFSYSQGLEWAVEAGTVTDEASALRWIGDQLQWNLGSYEAPLLAHLLAAHKVGAGDTVKELDAHYLASRESAELRAETLQMGYSLRKLILDLALPIAVPPQPTSFPRPGARWSRTGTLRPTRRWPPGFGAGPRIR